MRLPIPALALILFAAFRPLSAQTTSPTRPAPPAATRGAPVITALEVARITLGAGYPGVRTDPTVLWTGYVIRFDARNSDNSLLEAEWSSSNPEVLSITSTGLGRGVGPGVATITARTRTRSATTQLTVVTPRPWLLHLETEGAGRVFVRLHDGYGAVAADLELAAPGGSYDLGYLKGWPQALTLRHVVPHGSAAALHITRICAVPPDQSDCGSGSLRFGNVSLVGADEQRLVPLR